MCFNADGTKNTDLVSERHKANIKINTLARYVSLSLRSLTLAPKERGVRPANTNTNTKAPL